MSAEGVSFRCPCGRAFDVTAEAASAGVRCPGCGRVLGQPPAASGQPSEPSLEKILLDKGWITQQQLAAAQEEIRAEERQGRKMRLGQALLKSGAITPEQLRQALEMQGKTPMRCPSCGKLYNVKGYTAGTRAPCRACGVALVPPGTALAEDAGDEGPLRRVPVGEEISPAMADLIPGYRIERRLGSGGMGDVYLARQLSLDRPVAVKLLPPEMGRDQEFVQRFLSEARLAAKVNHVNLVTALDAGESGGRHYFVMEYVDGEPLSKLLRREGPLQERRALDIARQIARGLRHAHAAGLIHRDVKPPNIMIMPDGTAKLCDFGLARETGPGTAIQAGRSFSSPIYASPEQCRGEPDLDCRTDMYSLGVTLFEMLIGRPPFQAESMGDLVAKHVNEAPPSPRTLNSQISAATDQIVLTLLSKPRKARYADYDELLGAIEAALAPPRAAEASRRIETLSRRGKPPYLKWIVAGAAAVAALLVLRRMMPEKAGDGDKQDRSLPQHVRSALREARQLEEDSRGHPNRYPFVLERWKELERKYVGTPYHEIFAGPLVVFQKRVESEAASTAKLHFQEANDLVDRSRYPEALRALRAFPAGFAGTEASRRVIARIDEIDRKMHERYQEAKEAIYTHISAERFREARRDLAALKESVSFEGPEGREWGRQEYADELDALSGKIEEEYVLAQRRRDEARAKENAAQPKESDHSPADVKPPTPAEETSKPPPPPAPAPPTPPPPAPSPAKLPEPDAAAQRNAQREIQSLFKEEYSRKTPAERQALARKFIELAGQTKDDPTSRYVLYREAQDLAVAAADYDLALSAVEEMARAYAVNAAAARNAVLSAAARNARTPEELKGLAATHMRLSDDALASDDLDEADRMAAQASALARKAKDAALAGRAEGRSREIAEIRPRFERAQKAREKLAASPEDGPSHLAMGQYLCLYKGDWTSGLLHLSRGSDAPYRAAAAKDLANPSEPGPQVVAGDGWWDLGERETGLARQALRRRAAIWYERALAGLTGLTRIKIQRRIDEIRAGK